MKQIKLILLIFVVIFAGSVSSQTVSYDYDAAGNRIKREIVFSSYKAKKGIQKRSFSESLAEKTIRIYPNPTKGMLKIEIIGWSDSDKGNIDIFNSGGARLISTPLVEPNATFDITDYSPGIYFMHVNILDEKTTWKIIKE